LVQTGHCTSESCINNSVKISHADSRVRMWLSDVSGTPFPSSGYAGGLVASVSVHMKQEIECLNVNYTKDL
jgi:hypothetical protein